MANAKGGLGRGLGSLIPPKITPKPGTEAAKVAETPETEIPVEKIVENPHQPRVYFSPADLEDLVSSIKKHGIIQPLLVTKKQDGTYELIAGERRLRSARMLGLKTVPAVVRKDASEQEKLELALIENIQRQNLNAIEEAKAYKSLADLFSVGYAEIGQRVGKSKSYIANAIRLLDLPEDMQEAVMEGKISRSHARTLLSETDPDRQRELFNRLIRGEKITVREMESKTGRSSRRAQKKQDPNIAAIEEELRNSLGTKVKLSFNGSTGKIVIHFYSKEEFKNLVKKLTE
ncbi:ParB/RepB/Spo0J family partition protein [Candidatus Parcubacteria bacterium]|nr:MAG: ParB/RepB/Spo0J family partition protein [Candidatus Parcubacteria bacterium]